MPQASNRDHERGQASRSYGPHRSDASIDPGCVRNASVIWSRRCWSRRRGRGSCGEASVARLDVDAAPSCSTRDELVARVAARSTRDSIRQRRRGIPTMTARIDAGPKGTVVAELTVVEPDGRRFARRLEAPSCAAATDALALVVAITLDPSAATAGAAPPPTRRRPRWSRSVRRRPLRRPRGRRQGGTSTATEAGAAARRPSTEPPTVAAAGEVVAGPAPAAMPGVALEVQAGLDRTSIWSPAVILTLSHVFSADLSEPDGRATFTLDLLGLDVCPVRVVLLRLEARACAAASVGRLAAQGSHTYDPRSVARPFATAGGTVRLTVPVVVARRGACPVRRGGGPVARCVRIHSRRVSPGRFGYPGGGRGGRRAVSVIG